MLEIQGTKKIRCKYALQRIYFVRSFELAYLEICMDVKQQNIHPWTLFVLFGDYCITTVSLTTDWLTHQRFPADPGAFIDPVPFSQFLSAGDEYRRPGQPGLWLPERPGILQQDLPDCEDVHKDQVSSSQLIPSLRTSLRGGF